MNLNRIPAPYLLPIILVSTLICLYYAIQFRKGDKRHLFFPTFFSVLCGISIMVSKLIVLWTPDSQLGFIVDVITVVLVISIIFSVFIAGIKQCRRGQIVGQKKRLLYLSFAVISICLVFFVILIIIAILK